MSINDNNNFMMDNAAFKVVPSNILPTPPYDENRESQRRGCILSALSLPGDTSTTHHSRFTDRSPLAPIEPSRESPPSTEAVPLQTISNAHQTATLMPEPNLYENDGEYGRGVRRFITNRYRKKKHWECKTFIHRALVGQIPAKFSILRVALPAQSNAGLDLKIKITARKTTGPHPSQLDVSRELVQALLTEPVETTMDEDYLHSLQESTITTCLQKMQEKEFLDQINDMVLRTWDSEELNEFEFWKWNTLQQNLRSNGELEGRDSWKSVNELVVWILALRAAWNWPVYDEFVKALGLNDFMIEWNDIEYDVTIRESKVLENVGRNEAKQEIEQIEAVEHTE